MNDYLSYFHDPKTGLFHGSLYRNKPTPSGCDRPILSCSTTEGSRLPSEAVARIAKAFPNADRPDPTRIAEHDAAMSVRLPPDCVVTTMYQKKGEDQGTTTVEVRRNGRVLPIEMSYGTFEILLSMGRLTMESSSGNDPELHYVYDHYEVVQPEGARHAADRNHVPPPARCAGTMELFPA